MQVRIVQHVASNSSGHTLAELGWGFEDVGLLSCVRWLTRAARWVRGGFSISRYRPVQRVTAMHLLQVLSGSYQFFPKVGVDFNNATMPIGDWENLETPHFSDEFPAESFSADSFWRLN
jgi:hypothetical protein